MKEDDFNSYINRMDNPLNDPNIIHKLSVATTHYAFRNGPVENMHAQGKLSEDNMMKLNKFIVNRLAYIFTLILDPDKIKIIELCCTAENIELKLSNATIEYSFIDGIKDNRVEIGKLDENDIEILVKYMRIKLMKVFNMFLEDNVNVIKGYLLVESLYGHDWDYAVPDSINFESFLEILKSYN